MLHHIPERRLWIEGYGTTVILVKLITLCLKLYDSYVLVKNQMYLRHASLAYNINHHPLT